MHELLYRQEFEQFLQGSIGDGYEVVACADCGTCFASGLPDEPRFAEYYADASKYDLAGEATQLSDRDRARYADQAAFVASLVADRDDPILDVGTATGGFLVALRDRGFAQPYGVDPSPDAVRVGREHVGLRMAVGGLGAAKSWRTSFGLISYVAVLEHLLDPRAQARAAARLLRPGGHLFVSVPDAASFGRYVDAPFQEFSVEHINFFTSRSLANAMAIEGYVLVGERVLPLPLGTDGQGPALEAVYRWVGNTAPLAHDESGARAINEYVRRCSEIEGGIAERIAQIADSGERILVWGTGTHTLHLLRTSRLAECRIEAFIDSNPHYAGATLAGRPVVAPSSLQVVDSPILVSSAVSQAGIADAARDGYGPDVSLILLYPAAT